MRTRIPIAACLIVSTLTGCGYNRIQALDEQVDELGSNIEVELVNRNNLIPNLVATVQGASEFERGTFTDVAEARAGLEQAREGVAEAVEEGDMQSLAVAADEANRQIGTYINVAVEAYPQLRATQSFMALQDQLAESENRISVARRDYNEAVRTYNTYVRQFPQVVTARLVGAERKEPFEAPEGAEQTPTVDFGTGS
ncbi:MAG: LemA family protein [Gemmatimonas sp.]|nr:LemA family protein [Gemmatimonas sp.]